MENETQTTVNSSTAKKRFSQVDIILEEAKRFCGGDLLGNTEERMLRSGSTQRTEKKPWKIHSIEVQEPQASFSDGDSLSATVLNSVSAAHIHAPSFKDYCIPTESSSPIERESTNDAATSHFLFNNLHPSSDSDPEKDYGPPVFGVPAPPPSAPTTSMIFGRAMAFPGLSVYTTGAEISNARLWAWTKKIVEEVPSDGLPQSAMATIISNTE